MAGEYLNKELWKSIIIDHMLNDIRWAIDAKRELVAARLLLAAIDVIAGLERPVMQEETTGNDLIVWSDKYLCIAGSKYQLKGLDIWGARCGFLHGYTANARVVRDGRARMLSYVDVAAEPVMTESADKGLVLASLDALFKAFVTGVIDTMKRINRDETIASRVNPRLEMVFRSVPATTSLQLYSDWQKPARSCQS
ncbi:hypothetical protein [Undibacterium sp.]|uniref:hypothetical protein n=1 Tax=Undibacterium sp. TaxID=1914977 RepID=UPI002BCDAADA|nr:hypothetical protein [Undibacterium sp.]HTD04443.1 hypothetical protein [Undibacterium sp.]